MTAVLTKVEAAEGHDSNCGAKKRQGEGSCTLRAGWGTDHVGYGRCKLHGGSTKGQRTAIQAQLIDDRARKLFGQDYEPQAVANPLAVFEKLSGRVVAWMEVLERLVSELDRPGYAGLAGEQVKAEVQLFERALDRCTTTLATHVRLDIHDRLVAVELAKAEMLLKALEVGLAAAGVTGSRAIEAKRVAGQHLRLLDGAVIEGETHRP